MSIIESKIKSIESEAVGKYVNIYLSGGICISGTISSITDSYIKIKSENTISYFNVSDVSAIQIFI